MAFEYQSFASLNVNLNRQSYGPLDVSTVFLSMADFQYYISKGSVTTGVSKYWYESASKKITPYPYVGQVVSVIEEVEGGAKVNLYLITNTDGATCEYITVAAASSDSSDPQDITAVVTALNNLTSRVATAEGKITNIETAIAAMTLAQVDVGANETLKLIKQENGKITVEKQTISITKSQISDFNENDYATADHKHTKADITDFNESDYVASGDFETFKTNNTAAIQAAQKAGTDAAATAQTAADNAQDAADAAQDDVDALALKVGTVPEGKDVVTMISDAQTAATYDDTQVKQDIKAIRDDYLTSTDKTELTEKNSTQDTAIQGNADAITAIKDGATMDSFKDVEDVISGIKDGTTMDSFADVEGALSTANDAIDGVEAQLTWEAL